MTAEIGSKPNYVTVALFAAGMVIQSGIVWACASFYYDTTPQLAVFDADKSVERFVSWSSERLDDEQFDVELARFGVDVERQIDIWSRIYGVPVVQLGSVISGGDTQLVDWTDVVVEEVLQ